MNRFLLSRLALFMLINIYPILLNAQTKEIWGVVKNTGDYGGGYIFKTDSAGQNITPVYSFKKDEGSTPYSDLCYAGNGDYYGTTYQGGANSSGVLFKFNSQSGAYEVVHHFINATGRLPWGAPLFASNGKLYGLTNLGGSNSKGVLYEYDPIAKSYQVLVNLDGTNSGSFPRGGLIEYSSGRLFGLTYQGGANNVGVLFEYNIAGDTLIKYVDFVATTLGSNPSSSLMKGSNGLLYGLCTYGGVNSNGTLFSFNVSNQTITKEFDLNSSTVGSTPFGDLVEYNSNLYGLASQGGASSSGTVFRYDIQADTMYNLHSFNSSTTGKTPYGSLALYNGKMYGLAYQGGANSKGTIFEINLTNSIFSKKYDFNSSPNAYQPRASFSIDSNGYAYATTYGGGAASAGTIIEYNINTDSLRTRINFNSSATGFGPYANLIKASDGFIYGTTSGGGELGNGVLYKFNPTSHQYTLVKDLNSNADGKYPNGSIIEASDGNLYGTAQNGGNNSYGVLYKYNPSSQTYSVVHYFDNTNGRVPIGNIAEGQNGLIYGITFYGGQGYGVLYSFNISSGIYTKLYDFYTDGNYPQSGVIVASNGKVYGTTTQGGVGGNGVLFEYDPQATSYSKINTPGNVGRLMQASNGKIYGTSYNGGPNYGFIFEYNPDSATYANIFNFTTTANGINPGGAVSEVFNNKLFGVTNNGGSNFKGVFYEFDLNTSNYSVLNHLTSGVGFDIYSAFSVISASPQITNNVNVASCSSYTSPSGKYTWTTSGSYIDTLMASSGADSILFFNLTIQSPQEVSIIGLPQEACAYGINYTLNADVSGGTFSGDNVDVDGFKSSTLGINNIYYQVIDSNGCLAGDTATINVIGLPQVNAGTDTTTFSGGSVVLSPTVSGGSGFYSYFWSPNNMVLSPNSQLTTTSNLFSDQTFSLTVTDDSSSCINTDQVEVFVSGSPLSVSVSAEKLSVCMGSKTSLTANANGGSGSYTYNWTSLPAGFSSNAQNVNAFPNVATSYIVAVNDGSSTVYDTIQISIFSPATVSISGLDSSYCEQSNSSALSGLPSGGSFSGNGVVNDVFDPGVSGLGNQTVYYQGVDANGCSFSDSIQTIVHANPVASFGPEISSDYCQNADSVFMTATPSGGVFGGSGVINNYFYPSMAQLGINSMYYTYTDSNGCAASYGFIYMNILATPAVQISSSLDSAYCSNSPVENVFAYPNGGSFSGAGMSGNTIDFSTGGSGQRMVKYTYTAANGCSNADSIYYQVNPAPSVSITSTINSDYCKDASPITLTAAPSGGTFKINGLSNTNFNPSALNVGTQEIVYNYTDGNGCSNADTVQTQIHALPQVSIITPIQSSYCANDALLSLSSSPAGGSYSGSITSNSFDPSTAILGLNHLVYTYTDGNGCTGIDSVSTTVNPTPTVNFTTQNDVCQDAGTIMLAGATPGGGTFSGPGVLAGGNFYPGIAGVGTHNLSYAYVDANGCSDTAQSSIKVKGLPTASFSLPATLCAGDTAFPQFSGQAGPLAQFNWNFDNPNYSAGTGSGPYSLVWDTTGLKQITLTVSDSGCTSSPISQYTNVLTSYSQVIAVGNTEVCYGDSVTLFANIGPGNTFQWYDTAGILTNDTLSYLVAGQSGQYYCEVTTNNGCPANSNAVTVTIKDQIIADFSLPTTACAGDLVNINFTGTAPQGASYNWNFDQGMIATGSNVGPYAILWNLDSLQQVSLQVSKDGCSSDLVQKNITLLSTPASITALGSTSFCDGGSVTLSANAGPNTYTWYKDGVSTGINTALFTATQAGSYKVEVTNSQTACSALSDSVVVSVNNTNFNLAFTANPTNFTLPPFNTTIANQTPNSNDYYWLWSFGDGQSDNSVNPTHQYQYDGTYTIEVIAQNIATGCYDTLTKTNYITCDGGTANPCSLDNTIANVGGNFICSGDSVKLYSKEHTAGVSYQWLKDGVLIGGQTDSIFYAKTTGLYQIMVSDATCNVFSQPFSLTVRTTIVPNVLSNGSIQPCSNDSMELYVSTSYTSYQWSNGATTPLIYVNTSGSYIVTVTDNNGCQAASQPYVVNASLAQAPQICIVGVDSATNRNRVIWERNNSAQLDSFKVYKETTVAGVYQLIATQPFSQSGIVLDNNSNPAQQSYRYRITAVDSCGMETPPSNVHKTIHLTINAGLNNSWNLIWSHYEGFAFGSYRIYRGSDSNNLQLLTQIQSTLNSYTDLNPPAGNVYYQIEVVSPHACYPDSIFSKAQTNYNTSRSNRANTSKAPNIGFSSSHDQRLHLRLYPNPNDGQFTIELQDKQNRLVELRIYNTLGAQVFSRQLQSSSYTRETLDLRNLSKGVYYLQLRSDKGLLQSEKVVIR